MSITGLQDPGVQGERQLDELLGIGESLFRAQRSEPRDLGLPRLIVAGMGYSEPFHDIIVPGLRPERANV
jgi:hypothetical protein